MKEFELSMPKSTTSKRAVKEVSVPYAVPMPTFTARAKPVIKWAGGKSQLIAAFTPYFPDRTEVRRYYEPFIGGAAVFFTLQYPRSFLSDSNAELIELYQIIRDDVTGLIKALKKHRNDEAYFYKVRSQAVNQLTPIERAARFIYLNKTCYNGLYRVNGQGQFNVPFGNYKKPNICDVSGLQAASLALQTAELRVADFEAAVATATIDDLVYFDPPYHPLSKTSSFTSYTASRFDNTEQLRLANIYRELDRRGCRVMLSNSDTSLIRDLYRDFRQIEVLANRAINSKADGRGKIVELLIINY
jgi:DNA adenine methylase